jgi:hypothetical protein
MASGVYFNAESFLGLCCYQGENIDFSVAKSRDWHEIFETAALYEVSNPITSYSNEARTLHVSGTYICISDFVFPVSEKISRIEN